MTTTTTLSTVGIVGSDNIVPVYDPAGRWTIWALQEIYVGTTGANRYVPKVNDWVVDYTTNTFYTVAAIDATTLMPTLNPINPLAQNQQFSTADLIMGVGPGGISDTFRVYLNQAVMPYTLTVDARLHTYSSEAVTFTIYRGTDLAGSSIPISQVYDASNQLIGTSVPLTLATDQGDVQTVKAFPTCYTTQSIPDGEKLVLITYSAAGHQVSKVELLVENTQFVPLANSGVKYITNISLESPFLSPSDQNTLAFPVNVNLSGLSLMGVVSYSDGSSTRLPVNNTRFSLRGLDNFVSTYAGQQFDLVLDYKLSVGEIALGVQTTPAGSITRLYAGITTNYEGMYSPKLYGFPVWQDSVNGYRLEWWLYDMDRQLSTLVTPYVRVNNNSPAFNPLGYGYNQALSVSINMQDVNSSDLALIHVQTINIILRQPGTARTTNWAIGFEPNQQILFGENNFAKMTLVNQNQMTLDITCGETTLANWLNRMYTLVDPLYDPTSETAPPTPTYFSVCTTSWEVAYPITQWNQALTLGYSVADSSTIFIKFFIRTQQTDIQLAIAALPVYEQS